jgi:tripartite-type tricarboxylate transporter receptor subunit TctC
VLLGATACGSGGSAAARNSSGPVSFAGKTVTLIVGTSPGGDYDIIARELQKVLPKYLPGAPRVVVQNVDGGDQLTGDVKAAHAKPDGLTVSFTSSRGWTDKVSGDAGSQQFDVTTMTFIGTPVAKQAKFLWCADRNKFPGPDVWADLLAAHRTITAGAAGHGTVDLLPAALEFKNQPIKVVYGYGGGSEVDKAFAAGETDTLTRCDSRETVKHPDFYQKKLLAPIAWVGTAPTQDYLNQMGWSGPAPPSLFDLAGVSFTDAEKDAFNLVVEMESYDQALFLPPGTDKSIVDAWTVALQKVVADPNFISAANAAGDQVGFAGEDKVDKAYADLANLPADAKAFLVGMSKQS